MFKSAYSVLNILSLLDGVKGRKKLQKIVHLLEVSGTKLPFKYEYHFFGPYSAELQEEVNYLVENGLLEESKVEEAYVYQITEKGKQFKQSIEMNEEQQAELDMELIDKLNEQNSQFLEVVSTYAFLLDSGYQPDEAKDKANELKPHLSWLLEDAITFYNDVFLATTSKQ